MTLDWSDPLLEGQELQVGSIVVLLDMTTRQRFNYFLF